MQEFDKLLHDSVHPDQALETTQDTALRPQHKLHCIVNDIYTLQLMYTMAMLTSRNNKGGQTILSTLYHNIVDDCNDFV